MEEYYAKLPKKLFMVTIKDGEGAKSYLKQIKDDKVIKIIDYFYTNTNRKGITNFTLEDLINECGYKQDRHKGKMNDNFKDVLINLKKMDLIITDFDFNKLQKNSYIKCTLNIFNKNEKGEDINFIQLYEHEKNKILNYKKDKIDNLVLLKLFCYLKVRMFNREDNSNIQATGGKAQVCYPSYSKIEEDIDISQSSIKKYIDILVDLNLIRYDNAGIYYPKGNSQLKRESANTYVLYDEYDNWKIELKESIKFFKQGKEENGFVFCKNNTYKNNNRKLNGELGALIRLKNSGKASDKQIKRIDEIRSELNSY